MNRSLYLILLFVLASQMIRSQESFSISGRIIDENGMSLPGCHVHIDTLCSITNVNGFYSFNNLPEGVYVVSASYIGFGSIAKEVVINGADVYHEIQMKPSMEYLNEFVVEDDYVHLRKSGNTSNIEIVGEDFMRSNLKGSMMKTLERMPGISTIEIGSGISKPVIRGLSFNRVVVAESGIKHEAQQWGADHGLEIDQFNIKEVEVIKGPASLTYGSDAIGGVIRLKPYSGPIIDGLKGSVRLVGRSNNGSFGGSVNLQGRKKSKFFSVRLTGFTNGDYQVPADKVTYNTFNFDLDNGYLRNTAGREVNGFLSGGLTGKWGISTISIGNYFNKSGFFADAHGFEIRNSDIDYDRSNRDIDLPYQQVNHFKVISNTTLFIQESKLEMDLSYQNNFRQEFAEPTEHGYRPLPPDSLERQFNKNTITGNFTYSLKPVGKNNFKIGLNTEFQNNKIGGWGFIIPAFERFTLGVFAYDKYDLTDKWYLNAGIRFDYGNLLIEEYTDWYQSPVYNPDGSQSGEDYKQRAPSVQKTFHDMSYSVGIGYSTRTWLLKFNLGRSFRIPDARELATDGVNYHMFRQEKGDPGINSERAWQADFYMEYHVNKTKLAVSPFLSYFPNYIYLNPTSEFSDETGLQVFNYVQNEVLRWGGEIDLSQQIVRTLLLGIGVEYVYSEQLSGNKEGFGLAFTPPPSSVFSLTWSPDIGNAKFKDIHLTGEYRIAAGQSRIVPPEEVTKGYQVFHVSGGFDFFIGKQEVDLHIQLHNVFNRKYFNHTSFYRLINIPEPGRNLQVTLIFPLKINKNLIIKK